MYATTAVNTDAANPEKASEVFTEIRTGLCRLYLSKDVADEIA